MIPSGSTDIIRAASLEERVAHRDRVLALAEQALALTEDANRTWLRACGTEPGVSELSHTYRPSIAIAEKYGSRATYGIDWVRQKLDRDCWKAVMDASGMLKLMGEEQRKEWRAGLENPPEFTIENVQATFAKYQATPFEVFARGVYETFRALPEKYRTNDRFKFGTWIILEWVVDPPSWRGGRATFNHRGRFGVIGDLHRVLRVLDGKADAPCILSTASAHMMQEAGASGVYDDDPYMTFKWFANGNAHIKLKRPELTREINRIVAEYAGETLAQDHAGR